MATDVDDLIRGVEEFRQIHKRLWEISRSREFSLSYEFDHQRQEREAEQQRLRRRLVHIESDIVEAFARARLPLPDMTFLDPADLDMDVERVIVRLRREERPVPRSPKLPKPRLDIGAGGHWVDLPGSRTILASMTLVGGIAGIVTLIAVFTDLL